MALPAPDLDDRRFQDLVDEAKRLIPRYCPEWTNHNLSDPGVALIELFAWMSEQVLFRLNQVPDRFYVKFLDLVGIEPFPPSVAQAPLTFWLSTVLDEEVVVPAGTAVATTGAGTGEAVVFTTASDLRVVQPDLVAARAGQAGDDERFVDVWDELRYEGAAATCFTSTPITPGDAIYLGFERSLAGNVVRLMVEATIEGIGVDPVRPPLVWEVWVGDAWVACPVHADTTGGLNRDGAITLMVPLAHEPLTLGDARAHWLRGRLLPAVGDQPGYQTSPQLRAVTAVSLGGTVGASHCEPAAGETIGRSDGSPGQELVVTRPPVLPRLEGEEVRVVTPGEHSAVGEGAPGLTDGVERWTEVDDFTASGPDDRHCTWDDATGTVRFGPRVRYPDGSVRQHGAIPRDGAVVAVTGYRHGGGARGNVGAGTLSSLRTGIPFIDRVINLAPATGGVDAETVANAKARGPMTLRTGNRAVTANDYERLTLESSTEVARARCLPPVEAGGAVRLLVVPRVRTEVADQHLDDFALSDTLVARISTHLDERRVLGTTVEVGTPFYQGISVAVLLRSLPGRPPTLVRQRALDLLHRHVNPLVGGVEAGGWPFDTDLNAAGLAQLLEAVDGVDRVEEVLLFEYDLRTGKRHGGGRDLVRLDRQSLFLSAGHQVVVR